MKIRSHFVMLLALLGLAAVVSAVNTRKLDPEADRLLKVYNRARDKAATDYRAALQPALTELLAKLAMRQDQLAKDGKLDEAVAVRDFANEIRKNGVPLPEPTATQPVRAPTPAEIKAFTGVKWRRTGSPGFNLLLNDDFSATSSHHRAVGCWALLPDGVIRLSISMNNCGSYLLKLVDGKLVIDTGEVHFVPAGQR